MSEVGRPNFQLLLDPGEAMEPSTCSCCGCFRRLAFFLDFAPLCGMLDSDQKTVGSSPIVVAKFTMVVVSLRRSLLETVGFTLVLDGATAQK